MSLVLPRMVVFDLDGTILDSVAGIEFSIRKAFESCGIPLLRSDFRELIGPPIRVILEKAGNIDDAGELSKLEAAFRTSYDTDGWRMAECFPGAVGVLRALRSRGHQIFVASNKPRHIALRILDRERIADLFDAIFTRDSRSPSYSGKDEMLRVLMSSYGTDRAEWLMVGDALEDAEAANSAGILFAHFSQDFTQVDGAIDKIAAFSFNNFDQFLPLLEKELV
jgi:phosphoglycolate phosphatase